MVLTIHIRMNGVSMNGLYMNGVYMNGFDMNGFAMNGAYNIVWLAARWRYSEVIATNWWS